MSPRNQVYYVQSKDRIHLLWKVSNVGDLPALDPDHPRYEAVIEHGFNSPFEEFAHEVHAGGAVEFHAYFIKAGADLADQSAGFGGGLDIESNNDGIHTSRMGFDPRGVTRPTRYAPSSFAISWAASSSGREISRPPEVCGS